MTASIYESEPPGRQHGTPHFLLSSVLTQQLADHICLCEERSIRGQESYGVSSERVGRLGPNSFLAGQGAE